MGVAGLPQGSPLPGVGRRIALTVVWRGIVYVPPRTKGARHPRQLLLEKFMRCPPHASRLLLGSLLFAFACTDNRSTPSSPVPAEPRLNIVNASAQCSDDLAKKLSGEIKTLYRTNADRLEANKRLQQIMSNCI